MSFDSMRCRRVLLYWLLVSGHFEGVSTDYHEQPVFGGLLKGDPQHVQYDVDGLFYEISALHSQGPEGHIQVIMYGLDQHHVDTKKATFQTEQVDDIWEFIVLVRRQWEAYLGLHERMEIMLLDPQIPPYWTNNQEQIHIICDLHPERGGLPAVVVNFLQHRHQQNGGYDARSTRLGRTVQCHQLFEVNYQTMTWIAFC